MNEKKPAKKIESELEDVFENKDGKNQEFSEYGQKPKVIVPEVYTKPRLEEFNEKMQKERKLAEFKRDFDYSSAKKEYEGKITSAEQLDDEDGVLELESKLSLLEKGDIAEELRETNSNLSTTDEIQKKSINRSGAILEQEQWEANTQKPQKQPKEQPQIKPVEVVDEREWMDKDVYLKEGEVNVPELESSEQEGGVEEEEQEDKSGMVGNKNEGVGGEYLPKKSAENIEALEASESKKSIDDHNEGSEEWMNFLSEQGLTPDMTKEQYKYQESLKIKADEIWALREEERLGGEEEGGPEDLRVEYLEKVFELKKKKSKGEGVTPEEEAVLENELEELRRVLAEKEEKFYGEKKSFWKLNKKEVSDELERRKNVLKNIWNLKGSGFFGGVSVGLVVGGYFLFKFTPLYWWYRLVLKPEWKKAVVKK